MKIVYVLTTSLFFCLTSCLTIYNSQNDYCIKMFPIDSVTFYSKKQPYISFNDDYSGVKTNGVLKIKTKSRNIVFQDDLSNEYYFEYELEGQLNNSLLVSGNSYNETEYYIINKKTGIIDTVVGFPKIYNNRLLSIEGDCTDGTKFIEVWRFKGSVLKLLLKFDTKKCNIFNIEDVYVKNSHIYIKYDCVKYVKIRI